MVDFEDPGIPPAPAAPQRRGVPVSLIAFAVVAAIAVVFVLQNRSRAEIDFLVFEVNARIWRAIAVAMVLGALLDRLFQIWWRRWRSGR